MKNKLTAMQIMLMDLEFKQSIYEKSGMYECATALVTSIEFAKNLINGLEKQQMLGFYTNQIFFDESLLSRFEQYYNETYGTITDNEKRGA